MSHTVIHPSDPEFPENPVKKLCEDNGWTNEHLSRATGLSKNTIYFVQRGMYNKIPPKLHLFFKKSLGDKYSPYEMGVEFSNWRWLKQLNAEIPEFSVRALSTRGNKYLVNTHPLVRYLELHEMTMLRFCEELAIPKSVVYNYTNEQQINMPQSLAAALERANISPNQIELLDTASREFYASVRETTLTQIVEINDRGIRRSSSPAS